MDKKTLLNLINNNILEIETLIESLYNNGGNKLEVKLIHSKFQTLKDEIEFLGNIEESTKLTAKEVDSGINTPDDIKSEQKLKENITNAEEDKSAVIEETVIEKAKEEKKETLEANTKAEDKNEEISIPEIEKEEEIEATKKEHPEEVEEEKSEAQKLIIQSSKPTKERVRRKIQRIKREDSEKNKPKIESYEETKSETLEEKTGEQEKSNHELEKPQTAKKKEKASIVADKFEVTKQSLNDIIANSNKTRDLSSTFKDKPIENLKKAVSINDKIRFTKELFEGKTEKYQVAIDTLNSCNNLDEALEYLNQNFNWDQEKDSFREFLELVYRRFINN